jgi:sigma-B regulation protein RsbU (phosphoserine phosphatase)
MKETGFSDEMVRLENENRRLRRAVEELSVLNEIATAVGSTLSLDRILDLIVQECLRHLKVEQGVVMLLDEKRDKKPFETVVRRGDTSRDQLPFRLDAQLTGWMLKNRTPLLINDFLTDTRFHMLLDDDFPIQSLLSVPLLFKGGMIGLLSVFNKRAEQGFSEDDQRLLSIIATQSAQVIENARLLEEEQAYLRIQEEFRLACEIQIRLLPTTTPIINGYDIAGKTIPAKEVGGDYFDFITVDNYHLAFCLGDVSGKGMPAALLMSNLQAAVRTQTMLNAAVDDCLKRLNTLLFHGTSAEKFATVFYAVLDTRTHEVRYANAGHNYPILFSEGNEPSELPTTGMVLGALESVSFTENTLPLGAGDLLVVYSDGVIEAMNADDEEFGVHRLVKVVTENRAEAAGRLVEAIVESVQLHSGNAPQTDDMTLLVLRREKPG